MNPGAIAYTVAEKSPWYTWPIIIGAVGVTTMGVLYMVGYTIDRGKDLVGQVQKPLEGGVQGLIFGKGGLLGGLIK